MLWFATPGIEAQLSNQSQPWPVVCNREFQPLSLCPFPAATGSSWPPPPAWSPPPLKLVNIWSIPNNRSSVGWYHHPKFAKFVPNTAPIGLRSLQYKPVHVSFSVSLATVEPAVRAKQPDIENCTFGAQRNRILSHAQWASISVRSIRNFQQNALTNSSGVEAYPRVKSKLLSSSACQLVIRKDFSSHRSSLETLQELYGQSCEVLSFSLYKCGHSITKIAGGLFRWRQLRCLPHMLRKRIQHFGWIECKGNVTEVNLLYLQRWWWYSLELKKLRCVWKTRPVWCCLTYLTRGNIFVSQDLGKRFKCAYKRIECAKRTTGVRSPLTSFQWFVR